MTTTTTTFADRIAEAVDRAPTGLTRTEIHALFSRNHAAAAIDGAVDELTRAGRYATETRATEGRPARVLLRHEQDEETKEGSSFVSSY